MEVSNNKIQKGFTFIELLVVISIMILLFSLTSANYRGFQSRRSLDNAVTLVKSDLRLAQEYARSGRKPDLSCQVLHGYKLVFTNNSDYTIEAECVVGGTVTDMLVEEREISNMEISGNDVLFNVLGRGTSILDPNSSETITITRTGSADYRTITIEPSGNFE